MACLLGTFPCIFLFFLLQLNTAAKIKGGKGRGNILVTAASASFGDKSRFCLPAVLKRKRIQTSRYSCLTLHPSESVFCCVWRLFFSWSWRRPLLWLDEDSFPRWRGPSWLRLARAGFRVPDSQVAGRRSSKLYPSASTKSLLIGGMSFPAMLLLLYVLNEEALRTTSSQALKLYRMNSQPSIPWRKTPGEIQTSSSTGTSSGLLAVFSL